MSVPTIALCTTPPSGVHHCTSSAASDYELNHPRTGVSSVIASSQPSTSQRPFVGGLSRLFSSASASSIVADDHHHRSDELSSSFGYSPFKGTRDHQMSPVSVFQGPSTVGSSSRSPSLHRYSGSSSSSPPLLNRFVRNGVGSCLDYDSLSLPLPGHGDGALDADELTFIMEDSFVEPPYVKELLLNAQLRHKIFYDEFVVKAFYEAEKAHRGQMRASGDPYLQHCVETAVLLAMIGANTTVVAAGLLHDTMDDSDMNYDYMFSTFGVDVADLVEGVSKLSQLSKLARDNNIACKTAEADRLHTMFLAMADARAALSSEVVKSFDEALIASAIENLEQALKDQGVSYHVLSGRHKSLYSIYSKMLKKNLSISEIHDIHGLRLIVEHEDDCYRALNIVHQIWAKAVGKFKDYIIHPKCNGYQSLHTVVLGEDMVPLEIQIRTKEMHQQAEFGFASHWRYKEGDCKHSSFVLQMVEWARWVVTWQCEAMGKNRHRSLGDADSIRPPCPFPNHSDDCPYSYMHKGDHQGPVFVIMMENEKMSVQEFPPNSTVMDLLERVGRGTSRWPPYSFPIKEELRPKLNHEPVSEPNQKLKMGDVVELTPAIPDEYLMEYREEIQRMYDMGLTVLSSSD
ncbi:hypothetical protein QJS10_CPB19g01900 [Acorus calamus]|uniref:GTP diphosphokinase n=1 Tax=Acorus calamus TaxID=4465 RepID=A0AAV9CJN8_ACOCL|nr:hypothetical protein QJS10_CPB19g01900 [Acorus calamus]